MLMRPFIEDGKCYYYLDSKQANSSRDSIQSCKFMRKIGILYKTFPNKHRFHPMSQRQQNHQWPINWHYKSLRKVREATEYNNCIYI